MQNGDRVRVSKAYPCRATHGDRLGTVTDDGRGRPGPRTGSVMVRWDGADQSVPYHLTFLAPADAGDRDTGQGAQAVRLNGDLGSRSADGAEQS